MPCAARLTDMHTCPMQTPAWPSPIPHVGGPVVGPGAPTVLIGGLPAAVMGDSCVCVGHDLRKTGGAHGRFYSSWRLDCFGMSNSDDRGIICWILLF